VFAHVTTLSDEDSSDEDGKINGSKKRGRGKHPSSSPVPQRAKFSVDDIGSGDESESDDDFDAVDVDYDPLDGFDGDELLTSVLKRCVGMVVRI
jgi:hypothetical protein